MNQFTDRRYVFAVAIILVGLVFIIRLFQLQVLDKSYEQYALSNAQSVRVIYPARGLIYDRNGEILVYNKAAYDIMVTPRQLERFDTTQLCRLLDISRENLKERLAAARSYSYRVPSVFMKQVSYENAALFQEKLFHFLWIRQHICFFLVFNSVLRFWLSFSFPASFLEYLHVFFPSLTFSFYPFR